MFDSAGGLRHLVYFEELALCESESDAAWAELSGGLVTLRLVDSWLEMGEVVVTESGWGVEAVREAVASIDDGRPAKRVLESLIETMVRTRRPDARAITPRLMAYAQSLDYDGRWSLAIDVYQTILDYSDPAEDQDVMLTAYLQKAIALRVLGHFELSHAAYASARALAEECGNLVGVLRADIGFAKIAIAKGNFPQAQTQLSAVIDRATESGLSQVRSMALHDRAGIAITSGDYELAVELAHRALQDPGSPREKDRILADMSGAFKDLGMRTAARDGYMVIAVTAQEQYLRWVATLNLMEIAALDGSEPVFEAYRRALGAAPLPPALQVNYQFVTGHGYRLLGDFNAARSWITRALHLAEESGTNALIFAAEQELAELDRGTKAPSPVVPLVVTPELEEAAESVRQMREMVLVRT